MYCLASKEGEGGQEAECLAVEVGLVEVLDWELFVEGEEEEEEEEEEDESSKLGVVIASREEGAMVAQAVAVAVAVASESAHWVVQVKVEVEIVLGLAEIIALGTKMETAPRLVAEEASLQVGELQILLDRS